MKLRAEPTKVRRILEPVDPPDPWSGACHRLDPYIGCAFLCQYCYGLPQETLPDRPRARYTIRIGIKTNAIAQLKTEPIEGPVWLGSHSDPYQPAEAEHRLSRACLGILLSRRARTILMTRSETAAEDLDLLLAISRDAGACIVVSLPTADPRAAEPLSPPLHSRCKLLRRVAKAGLPAGVALSPIFPYQTRAETLKPILERARAEGAGFLLPGGLSLRGPTRMRWLSRVAERWPEAAGRYRLLFPADGNLPELFERAVAEPILALGRDLGFSLGTPFASTDDLGRGALWRPA